MAAYSQQQKDDARLLWRSGIPGQSIVRLCGLNNVRILYKWRKDEQWEAGNPVENLRLNLSIRYNSIMDSPDPLTGQQRQETAYLSDELLKLAKVEAIDRGESPGRGRPPGVKNGEGRKKSPKTNDVSHLTAEDFANLRKEILYPHQMHWWEAGQNPETRRTRFILKSRQIGATWFCSFEAFEDAVLNKNNQAFVSATRQQAEIFKSNIALMAYKYFGITLRGNPTTLTVGDTKVTLNYLSNNTDSAQGYSGNVYFDECFWTRGFSDLWKVASKISTHRGYRRTLISTPSAISHEAYAKWSGKEYNEGRPVKEQIEVDLSHDTLRDGVLGEDHIWRQMISAEDAVDYWKADKNNPKGLIHTDFSDHIDLDEIRRENSPNDYKIYYDCQFIDDSNSIFSLSQLISMGRDPYVIPHFDKNAERPYGNHKTTGGYDPGGKFHHDAAVLLSLPSSPKEKFWSLELSVMKNRPHEEQHTIIADWNRRYNIQHFEYDNTSAGQYLEERFRETFPDAVPIQYTPKRKTAMINKALAVFQADRFRYNAIDKIIPLSFMAIIQKVTPGTGEITYGARESKEAGHGDVAFAHMHAFMGESLVPEQHSPHDSITF